MSPPAKHAPPSEPPSDVKQPDTKQPVTSNTQGPKKQYGKHATMPVLQADCYAEIDLPDLPYWDPTNPETELKLDATVVAVGKRRTGKSWAFRNLMYLMKDRIPAGIVISQTDELNKFWRDYVPKQFIYPKYEPEILDAVFKRQKAILNDKNLTKSEKEKLAPFFVLLDDVISDQRLKYDENLMELFVAGRHYKIFVLITTQYAKAITPTLRGNTDYCLIMKTIQGRQREALWEDFGDFLTKDAFNRIVDAYTEDNEILIVNTCPELHVDPMEMLSWWKAQEIAPFRMGSKKYWEAAMNADSKVPPKEGPESASHFLSAKDIMPKPWDQLIS
jgi:hypothetical protein